MAMKDKLYFKDRQKKIELVSCLHGGNGCSEQLTIINERFVESDRYIRNKDYIRSINALKNAFEITSELPESSCANCAQFFRETITKSLENIHDDLAKLSNGFFRPKRYQSCYRLAGNTLEELKRKQ